MGKVRASCSAAFDFTVPGIVMAPSVEASILSTIGPIDKHCNGVEDLPDLIVYFGETGLAYSGSVRIPSRVYINRVLKNAQVPNDLCTWGISTDPSVLSRHPSVPIIFGQVLLRDLNAIFSTAQSTVTFFNPSSVKPVCSAV